MVATHNHCAEQANGYWDSVVVRGVKMKDAVQAWWLSDTAKIHRKRTRMWVHGQQYCDPTCKVGR